ncbi:hypothetical protein, partial [Wolbachia endosymbiont of Atemnus politus]|uniref:hypothetical protein n=1 Tax=Wolbachia endosymbiont of Atemnus politus TaxID=2682840 RepID=UPI001C552F7E
RQHIITAPSYSIIGSKLASRGFFCLFLRLVNFLMFVAKAIQGVTLDFFLDLRCLGTGMTS